MHGFGLVRAVLVAALASLALGASTAGAATRSDADWSEAYFPAGDGVTQLHADILRPKGLAAEVRTPVVLTVSPYTGHSGQTPTEFNPSATGPSARFFDFLDVTGLLTKGYTYVMVDLPGFGGSAGCNDWGGAREQDAVRAAVEWAAAQSWSTGRVAMFGKSYDGWTGLMAMAQQPKGLAAVVSLEPVYSGYRYVWMNGERRTSTAATVATFQAGDARPGTTADSPQYLANSAPQAWCYGINIAGPAGDDDEQGPYWKERNLVPTAVGKTTPLFLTQGFLEYNTLPDAAFEYFNSLPGRDNRAWFGQWDHCRPWETADACGAAGGGGKALALGRQDFAGEVMRFLDEHLKGIAPKVTDPRIVVQDESGRFRAESDWPPRDSRLYATDLNTGSYADDGNGSASGPTAAGGIWTVSAPLDNAVWLAGEPVVTAGIEGVPNANFAAAVYDVAPNGKTLLVSRGVSLLRGIGQRTVTFTMFGQDWKLPAGHRIAVLLSDADTQMFQPLPTNSNVTVRWANIKLPFLTYERAGTIEGVATPRLKQFQATAFTLPASVLPGAQRDFTLPGPLQDPQDQR